MKKIILVIAILFISINAFSQKGDDVRNNYLNVSFKDTIISRNATNWVNITNLFTTDSNNVIKIDTAIKNIGKRCLVIGSINFKADTGSFYKLQILKNNNKVLFENKFSGMGGYLPIPINYILRSNENSFFIIRIKKISGTGNVKMNCGSLIVKNI